MKSLLAHIILLAIIGSTWALFFVQRNEERDLTNQINALRQIPKVETPPTPGERALKIAEAGAIEERRTEIVTLLDDWAMDDFPAAWEFVSLHGARLHYDSLQLIESLARLDVTSALAAAEQREVLDLAIPVVANFTRDPKDCAHVLASISDAALRDQLTVQLQARIRNSLGEEAAAGFTESAE